MREAEWRVLVTGAGSAVGAAVAHELLARGAAVVAADADAEALAPLADAGAEIVAADVADEDGRTHALAAAGALTHLAIGPAASVQVPLAEAGPDHVEAVLRAGFGSVFGLLRDVCPALPAGGAVAVVASVAGKSARNPEIAAYSASEAATLSLVRSFGQAFAPAGVRVNAACTGIVAGPNDEAYLASVAAVRGTTPEAVQATRLALVPMGRPGLPQEIAATVRYLLSDDAAFVTAQAINVTGGFHTT